MPRNVPRYTKIISTKIGTEQYEEFKKKCKQKGLTISERLRKLVEEDNEGHTGI